jgi:hypothetical protein
MDRTRPPVEAGQSTHGSVTSWHQLQSPREFGSISGARKVKVKAIPRRTCKVNHGPLAHGGVCCARCVKDAIGLCFTISGDHPEETTPAPITRRWSEREIPSLVLYDSSVVIPMVIQTIQLAPPGPNGTDNTPHVTSLDPTGGNQSDAEHPPTDLAVGGSSPSRRATKTAGQTVCGR